MTRQTLARFGQIDVVMANAGIQPPGGVSTIEARHFELEFRVNVFGAFYAIRAALPSMIERRAGSIIAITTGPGGVHYGATKRAIEALTIGLANELRDKGIAVNALRPTSSIRTPGALFRRTPEQRAAYQGLTSESYEEAAVLLALQTPATFTGMVVNDAQVVQKLGNPADFARFRALYPDAWAAAVV